MAETINAELENCQQTKAVKAEGGEKLISEALFRPKTQLLPEPSKETKQNENQVIKRNFRDSSS